MNPRHAAALALVGWYLIVAPNRQTDVPLGRWEVVANFDSEFLCDSLKTDDLQTWLITKGHLALECGGT
jgi:hypothetical protein